MTSPTFYSFTCGECGWTCQIKWIPDNRIDPGYLDGDPPEECPECGGDMTEEEGERVHDDPSDDGDAAYDMAKGEGLF